MNKETIIADHSQAYMFDIDVDNQTTLNSVGIYEVAALLNLCEGKLQYMLPVGNLYQKQPRNLK